MLFQSVHFLIFFSAFFIVYWTVSRNVKLRNLYLLAGSVFLYSLWDIRFLIILVFIIITSYCAGILLNLSNKQRNLIFYTALILNLLPLLFFKYYNFFAENISDLFSVIGLNTNVHTIRFLLPVGISFYTFLSVSYLIDVYKKHIEPENNLVDLALSFSYFPIVVSGPIHRPRYFLNQIKEKLIFDHDLAAEGCRQILTGLFYKVVIADNLAKSVNSIFGNFSNVNGFVLLVGSISFTFQLYFDFNGYSEMAIGISKLLGIKINRNFRYPYLSRTIADFWKRWHISLTEWFRDYIFLPVSYKVSRKVKSGSVLDKDIFIYAAGIIVTWTLTGFWHGAGWTFILWGMIHAFLLIANKSFFKTKKKILKKLHMKKDDLRVIFYESIVTFLFVNFAWIFFRSETVSKSFEIIKAILFFPEWELTGLNCKPLIMIVLMLTAEFIQRKKEFLFDITGYNKIIRWSVYMFAAFSVLYYSGNDSSFIYMGF